MSNKILPANIFNDNCAVLFFILVFLLLFWGKDKGSRKIATNEVD